MFRELFTKSPLLIFPLMSLVLFGTIFMFVVFYVIRRGRSLEERALLALEKEVGRE